MVTMKRGAWSSEEVAVQLDPEGEEEDDSVGINHDGEGTLTMAHALEPAVSKNPLEVR